MRYVLMKHPITVIIFIFLLAGLFPPIACGEGPSATGPVRIKADTLSHDKESDTYRASGNVEIVWDTITLFSDMASLNQASNEAEASGNVRLLKDGDLLTGDRLRINVGTEQGEVINGDLFVKQTNFRVRGKRMAKVGKDDYLLEQGTFTTCDGDSPSWKFTAGDLSVTLEEYASGHNAVFYVKDIPLFYTPYIIFPVKRERQSGFLLPRIGSSTKKGFFLDIPYYWAISPSQDVTFDLELESKRGVGVGVDYRYIRKRGSEGSFRGFGIYDTQQERFRGDVAEKHMEELSSSLTFKSDINMTLERDFYRDFTVTSGIYNQQILESSASLTKNWASSSLAGEFKYIDNLDALNNRETQQRLPTLTFTAIRRRAGSVPLYFALDSDFTNFYRAEGQRGERLDFRPSLTLYEALPAGLGLSVWGGYRQRLYNAFGAESGKGYHGDGLADAGALISTTLARVYDTEWGGVKKVKHTLIPEAGYRYVQEKGQDTLPFFDFNDRVVGESMTTWSLTSYLTGKILQNDEFPAYRDLLSMRLSQGYQLSGSRRDLLTLVDEGRPFTDIRLEARFNPMKRLSVSTDSRFNPYRLDFSTAAIDADVTDDRGNLAGVGYHFSRGQVEYLAGKVGVALVKPFIFNYTGRYSFDRGAFLEAYYAVEYKAQCWSIIFSFRDRPDNREFLVSFALAGVGAVGPMKAF
ncbi:MAG: LPS-assembly [Geobacteraceae bacterium]|nr:MAG: LPS-assembly [Geobacteraceae bacterium]